MKKPLSIALVTNNYTPYSGGVVSSISVLAQGLIQEGYRVHIITLDFVKQKQNDPPYVKRLICPIKFRYKKNHMAIPWRPDKQIYRLLQSLDVDLIHVHHPFLLGISALQAGRRLNKKVIFTYHTRYEDYNHYVPLFPRLSRFAIKKSVKAFCKQVDHIIVPSTTIQSDLLQQTITTPIAIVPSAIADSFTTTKPPIKHTSDHFKLLYVGRFAQEKNIPFLFEVMHKLDDKFQLTLAGYGDQYEHLKNHAFKTVGLSPTQIRFVHKPDKTTIHCLYKEADLFLFPSTTDTQGLVINEAMASATPVIALDGPGQKDSVAHGVNGFIVNNQDEMIHAINKVHTDSALHKQLQNGAWQSSLQYRPAVFIKKIKQVYLS